MSESSSEDENTARLSEAVWSFEPQKVKISGKDGDNNSKQSRRTDVSKHQHDGNELGTTPEFQSHVSKKLGAFLDGCISEVFSKAVDLEPDQSENRDENEECFRLFSTSAPGNWTEEPLPPPPKRRPIPSSSDSDSELEMRLREAAVSVSDILASATQNLTEKREEKSVTKDSVTTEEVTIMKKKKKKKKRKASTKKSEENNTHVSEKQSNGEVMEEKTSVVEYVTNKKRKKKKRIKLEEDKKDCDE